MPVLAHLAQLHHVAKDHVGRAQLRHGECDRAEPADLVLGRHRALRPGPRLAPPAVVDHASRWPSGSSNSNVTRPSIVAMSRWRSRLGEPLLPPRHAPPGNAQPGADNAVRAAFLARRRPVEEGEIGARPRLAVGIKQVIRGNIVLVAGLLDQPHAEHLRVELHVAGGVGGDGGQMMDAGELHESLGGAQC